MSKMQEQYDSKNDEISLKELIIKFKDLFLYLKSKWKVIFLVGFIGAIIGYVNASLQTPTYTATLSFALEDDKSGGGFGGALGLASSFGFDLGGNAGGAFNGANLIELMKSRRLVEQTLLDPVTEDGRQISLAEMYIQFNGWRKVWEENKQLNNKLMFVPGSDRIKFSLEQDSVLGIIFNSIIKNNLTVAQKDKKISIINIDVKSKNELFSKFFAEILAKEISDFYIETKSKKAKINLTILERQADSIRGELNSAITGVAIANDNTYNLNPALNVRRTPSVRRQVDVQANTAILTELVKNLELARVTLRKETPLIQVIDRPILPLLKEKASRLKGLLVGTFVATFLSISWLLCKRTMKKMMK